MILQLKNLSKNYPLQLTDAVKNVSLEMKKGEIISLVGENGSGKTTILKLIYGLEDADAGEVLFQKVVVKGPSENLVPGNSKMKFVDQGLRLFPKHTIRENILFDIRILDKSYQNARLTELLKLFYLEGIENKLPSELSGGQQQRVALAKALAEEKPLLLMDEPFSNLDVMLKDEIQREVIRNLRSKGQSMIFVTHEMKDALALSDRIAVIGGGKILQIDTPHKVYSKPVNKYVARLFGSLNVISVSDFFKVFPDVKSNSKFNDFDKGLNITFRPEHLRVVKESNGQCKGTVKFITYYGDWYELDVEVCKILLRVKSRNNKWKKGDEVYLKLSLSKVHLMKE